MEREKERILVRYGVMGSTRVLNMYTAVANESRAKISYASFIYSHFDAEVEPIDQMVDRSRMYKKVKNGDYL